MFQTTIDQKNLKENIDNNCNSDSFRFRMHFEFIIKYIHISKLRMLHHIILRCYEHQINLNTTGQIISK